MKNIITILLASSFLLSGTAVLRGSTFYWGSDTTPGDADTITSWQIASHWFQEAAGTNVATTAPGSLDDAVFSITSLNATALVPRIFANTTINSITFNNTAALTITGGGGNRELHFGAGGLTLNSGAGAVTLGTSTANRNVLVRFDADQTWTNNSSSTVNIRNSATASNSASGPVVLTFNATGTGGISNSGAYSDGTAGSLGLVVASTGSGAVTVQNSLYSGGTTIRSGLLAANGANIGTATVRLGHSSGSANATLRIATATATVTNLEVQAGSTGTKILEFTSTSGGAYTGTITLNNHLEVGVRATEFVTLDGVISGTGDLTKGQYQGGTSGTLTLTADNTYSGDTFVTNGTLILADNASLTFYPGADGATNGIDGTGIVTLDGDFVFDLAGTAQVDGNSWQIVDVAGLTETFGSTFSVQGFTETAGVWTSGGYNFSESTGLLTYTAVPESSAWNFVAAGSLGLLFLRRRGKMLV